MKIRALIIVSLVLAMAGLLVADNYQPLVVVGGQTQQLPSGSSVTVGSGTVGDLMAWASSGTAVNYAGSASNVCGAGSAATSVTFNALGSASVTCGAAGGVTSVACGTNMSCSPSPITATGTVSTTTAPTFTGVSTLSMLNLPICTISAFSIGGPRQDNWNPSGTFATGGAACNLSNAGIFQVTCADNQGTRISGIDAIDNSLPVGTVRTFCNLGGTADDGVCGFSIEDANSTAANRIQTAWSSGGAFSDTLSLETGDCLSFILENPLATGNRWYPMGARVRQNRATIENLEFFPWMVPTSTITGTVNNWNPTQSSAPAAASGLFEDYTVVVVSTTDGTGATITGMSHGTGGGNTGKGEGAVKCLYNAGPGPLIIPHHNAGSTSSNWFELPGGVSTKIRVTEQRCFWTQTGAWNMLGTVHDRDPLTVGVVPKACAVVGGETTSNEDCASAIVDSGTATTLGPVQIADVVNPLSGTFTADVIIAPSGSTTTPAQYLLDADSTSITVSSGAPTVYALVGKGKASNAGGTNVAIYGEAASAANNYALQTTTGKVYFGLGGSTDPVYSNNLSVDVNKVLRGEGLGGTGLQPALELCGGDFNGGTKKQIASAVAPTANHGSISADATNFQGAITSIGANTSVTLTYGGSGFGTTSHCYVTVEGGTAAVITNSTVSKTAPVFSCFDMAGAALNCPDFNYQCWGN